MGSILDALGPAVEERIAFAAPSRRVRLALADQAVERYAGRSGLRLLDAGCGDGQMTVALARRHPEWRVLGVDLREDLIALGRARARELPNARFRRADLAAPLPEGGFDAVLAIEILEEIADDTRALEVLAAALVPGGLMVVHVPERSWAPILPGSAGTWREEVRHGYGAERLAGMLAAAGLVGVHIRPTYRATAVVAQEIRDRMRARRLAARALAFPGLAAAAALEYRGLTGGRPRALFALAWRPAAHRT
jgi:SAM-dependent methyltransferase